jgi:geranylgeranyl transferase type-2 subunit beta
LWNKCQNEDGGIGGNIYHDSHITCSLYAVLILSQYDSLDAIDTEALAKYVAGLQQKDGSFSGDSRFSYTAISCLTLLNRLDLIDVKKAREFILRCNNIDGAFGAVPDAESHAAYTFWWVGALAILEDLDLVDIENLGIWLSQRQTLQGGFNGRPEKLPDVWYSWWIMSACYAMKKAELIDLDLLEKYILNCQDDLYGGIGDRPGNEVDVFHTFFGTAALSLMGRHNLNHIDPRFAIPTEVLKKVFPHIK